MNERDGDERGSPSASDAEQTAVVPLAASSERYSPSGHRRAERSGLRTFRVLLDNFSRIRGFAKFTKQEIARLSELRALYVVHMNLEADDIDDVFEGTYLQVDPKTGYPTMGKLSVRVHVPKDLMIDSPLITLFNTALGVFTDYISERLSSRAITHLNDLEYLFAKFLVNDFMGILALGTSKRQLDRLKRWKRLASAIIRTADNDAASVRIFTRTEVGDGDLTMYATLNTFSLHIDWMIRVVELELSRRTIADELKTISHRGREAVRLLIEIVARLVSDKAVPESATIIALNSPSFPEKYLSLFKSNYLLGRVYDEATSLQVRSLMQCDQMNFSVSLISSPAESNDAPNILELKPVQPATERFLSPEGGANLELQRILCASDRVNYHEERVPLGLSPVYEGATKAEVVSLYLQILGWLQILSQQLVACEEAKRLFSVGGEILIHRHASSSMIFLTESLQQSLDQFSMLCSRVEALTETVWRMRRERGPSTQVPADVTWSRNHAVIERKLDLLKSYLEEMLESAAKVLARIKHIRPITEDFKTKLASFMTSMREFAMRYHQLMPHTRYRRFLVENDKQLQQLLAKGLDGQSPQSSQQGAIEYAVHAQQPRRLRSVTSNLQTNFIVSTSEVRHEPIAEMQSILGWPDNEKARLLDVQVVRKRFIYFMLEKVLLDHTDDEGGTEKAIYFVKVDKLPGRPPSIHRFDLSEFKNPKYKPRFHIHNDNNIYFFFSPDGMPYTYSNGEVYIKPHPGRCLILSLDSKTEEVRHTPWHVASFLPNGNVLYLVNGYEEKSNWGEVSRVQHRAGFIVCTGLDALISSMSAVRFSKRNTRAGAAKLARFGKQLRRRVTKVFGHLPGNKVVAQSREGQLVILDHQRMHSESSPNDCLQGDVTAHAILTDTLHVTADVQSLTMWRGIVPEYRIRIRPEHKIKRIIPLSPTCFAVKYALRKEALTNSDDGSDGESPSAARRRLWVSKLVCSPPGEAEPWPDSQALDEARAQRVKDVGESALMRVYHWACKDPIFSVVGCEDIAYIDSRTLLLYQTDGKISSVRLPAKVAQSSLERAVRVGAPLAGLVRRFPENILPLYEASSEGSILLNPLGAEAARYSVTDVEVILHDLRRRQLTYRSRGQAYFVKDGEFDACRENNEHMYVASHRVSDFAESFTRDMQIIQGACTGEYEPLNNPWSHMPSVLVCALYISRSWYAIRVHINYAEQTANMLWDSPLGRRCLPDAWLEHIKEVVVRAVKRLICHQCRDDTFRFEMHEMREYFKPAPQCIISDDFLEESATIVLSNISDYLDQPERLASEYCANSRYYSVPAPDAAQHGDVIARRTRYLKAAFDTQALSKHQQLCPNTLARLKSHCLKVEALQKAFQASEWCDELEVQHSSDWDIFLDGVVYYRLTNPGSGRGFERFSTEEFQAGIEAVNLTRHMQSHSAEAQSSVHSVG